ncbi:HEXIM [Asbolus verrucosus]|uniref:HEXIM n=1 Tax=Asbolus verrucosus TaxID=1661398 RepID=A0A482WCE9_ASBVE|nr:HEXIM [Asbolus verrucosus]
MSEERAGLGAKSPGGRTPGTLPQDDVVQQKDACAPARNEHKPKAADCDIPTKKRKTRRGKSKRRYPYLKNGRKSNKVIKPEAPYNSNQFLLEDHGNIEELDENLKHADQISTTSAGRTRDSSFSVDSEGEFYSSPDDEEQFLIKDFVDQYESVQAERLHAMTKDELIQEYLILETKLELLAKRQRKRAVEGEAVGNPPDLQNEVERLTIENDALKRENAVLRSKTCSSDSEDSETDSNDSCSSTSSSSSCCSTKPSSPVVDYSQTNGHSASVETV